MNPTFITFIRSKFKCEVINCSRDPLDIKVESNKRFT